MGWLILGLAIFYWYSKRDLKRYEKSLEDIHSMPEYHPEPEQEEPPEKEAPVFDMDEVWLN